MLHRSERTFMVVGRLIRGLTQPKEKDGAPRVSSPPPRPKDMGHPSNNHMDRRKSKGLGMFLTAAAVSGLGGFLNESKADIVIKTIPQETTWVADGATEYCVDVVADSTQHSNDKIVSAAWDVVNASSNLTCTRAELPDEVNNPSQNTADFFYNFEMESSPGGIGNRVDDTFSGGESETNDRFTANGALDGPQNREGILGSWCFTVAQGTTPGTYSFDVNEVRFLDPDLSQWRSQDIGSGVTEIHTPFNIVAPDTTPPIQSNHLPISGTRIGTISQSVGFNLDENGDCKWAFSGIPYSSMIDDCTGDGTTAQSCFVSGMSEGANPFYIACRDEIGNSDSSGTLISYTVDQSAPGQLNHLPASGTINTSSPAVSLNTDEDANCSWSLDDVLYNSCNVTGSQAHSCSTSGLMEGANTVYVSCADDLGNANISGTPLSYTVDTTAPTVGIDSVGGSSMYSTSTINPAIDATTDEDSNCRWEASDLPYESMTDCAGSGTASHTCTTAGLGEGNHTVYVACRDGMDNEGRTSAPVEIDTTPPVQVSYSPPSGITIPSTSWDVAVNLSERGSCSWSLDDVVYNGCAGAGTANHTCSVSGLINDKEPRDIYFSCADDTDVSPNVSTSTYNITVNSDIPAVSTWGLIAMGLLTLTGGTVISRRREEESRIAYEAARLVGNTRVE